MIDKYKKIINLPHHVSNTYKRMTTQSRAAQFSAFRALNGYEEEINEVSRLTDKKIELDEGLKSIINKKIQFINENLNLKKEITFTYFIYDEKKIGGKYIDIRGIVKKIDINNKLIILTDNKKIPIEEILDIKGNVFEFIE